MQLTDLKQQWHQLTRTQKLEIVERSNVRRAEAFEIRKNKGRKKSKKKSSSKSRKRKKSTPKTAEGLARLLKDMSPEEVENFKLMIQTKMNE